MKYLKKFESYIDKYLDQKVFFRVETKQPNFEIVLKKIGLPEDEIEEWTNNKNIQDYDLLDIGYDPTIRPYYSYWSHVPTHLSTYTRNGYRYLGTFSATQEEVDLYLDTKKYNI